MQAGNLRHRIQLTVKTVTRNAVGEEIVTYPVTDTVWARVDVLGGSEPNDQQRVAANLTHTVTLRYRTGLEPTMQVNWVIGGQTRPLLVNAITEDTHRRTLTLACREIVP